MAELQHELRPQRPATDPVQQFLVEKEIREALQGMDELEVRVLYEDLAVTGRDDMTMLAVENAPASFPLISDPAILDAGKRGRGENSLNPTWSMSTSISTPRPLRRTFLPTTGVRIVLNGNRETLLREYLLAFLT